MAFPSNSSNSLSYLWSAIKGQTGYVKNQCEQLISAPAITRRRALEAANALADTLAALDAYTAGAATNGLLAYAQEQENNPALNLVSEYQTMRTQMVATQDWLVANFPKNASNELCVYSFDANKRYADINLTAPQLSAFKAQLSAISATIA